LGSYLYNPGFAVVMKLEDFNYNLPKELIAQSPLKKRPASRLMVLKANNILHKTFPDILDYLDKDDVIVVNETKVSKAMLFGRKSTGSDVIVILTKKLATNKYECRIKGKPRKGSILLFSKQTKAEIIDVNSEGLFKVKFNSEKELPKLLTLPLPFYVKKELKQQNRYQTIFSKTEGSLAAPTASLHFDKQLIKKIQQKGVKIAKICLHIDFGTFLPIRESDLTKHKMHTEEFEITKQAADTINNCKGKLIAIGTTTIRSLESAADNKGKIHPKKSKTDLFIYPGYKFKTKINAMITNFHLPKSSLLLLVSAFYSWQKLKKAYQEAIKNKYRFYSFGDAMLIIR